MYTSAVVPAIRFSFPQNTLHAIRQTTRRIDTYLDKNETGYRRMARVRKASLNSPHRCKGIDRTFGMPEQFKSPLIRGLIHLANCLEEIAEGCADLSGQIERLVRHAISSGEKSDMARVLASATGRVIAGQMNHVGVSVHKAAGASLYVLSSLVSLTVHGLAKTQLGMLRTPEEIEQARLQKHRVIRLYEPLADKLLSIKHGILDHAMQKLQRQPSSRANTMIQNWVKHLHREHFLVPPGLTKERKSHCSYMWNNIHQYGRITQGLMHASFLTFQVVNRIMVSYDRHLGTAIGERLLAKKMGSVLGCRIGLSMSVGVAAGVSVPLSPLLVGISTVGAVACGFALVALLLAKVNVKFLGDWKGEIQPPAKVRFLAE